MQINSKILQQCQKANLNLTSQEERNLKKFSRQNKNFSDLIGQFIDYSPKNKDTQENQFQKIENQQQEFEQQQTQEQQEEFQNEYKLGNQKENNTSQNTEKEEIKNEQNSGCILGLEQIYLDQIEIQDQNLQGDQQNEDKFNEQRIKELENIKIIKQKSVKFLQNQLKEFENEYEYQDQQNKKQDKENSEILKQNKKTILNGNYIDNCVNQFVQFQQNLGKLSLQYEDSLEFGKTQGIKTGLETLQTYKNREKIIWEQILMFYDQFNEDPETLNTQKNEEFIKLQNYYQIFAENQYQQYLMDIKEETIKKQIDFINSQVLIDGALVYDLQKSAKNMLQRNKSSVDYMKMEIKTELEKMKNTLQVIQQLKLQSQMQKFDEKKNFLSFSGEIFELLEKQMQRFSLLLKIMFMEFENNNNEQKMYNELKIQLIKMKEFLEIQNQKNQQQQMEKSSQFNNSLQQKSQLLGKNGNNTSQIQSYKQNSEIIDNEKDYFEYSLYQALNLENQQENQFNQNQNKSIRNNIIFKHQVLQKLNQYFDKLRDCSQKQDGESLVQNSIYKEIYYKIMEVLEGHQKLKQFERNLVQNEEFYGNYQQKFLEKIQSDMDNLEEKIKELKIVYEKAQNKKKNQIKEMGYDEGSLWSQIILNEFY
ncbi:hypothetical protein PPERSA_00024 [Pseudocohnilembus persalinus]|uniref:Uncharacterized protein n=1 Tax=Pseudocohnilembus persalinus TaxID=266149 RepID=A0A0V0QVW6_PSEPJ|nr:hypothetical protein PPERSA_00024 [Pseudocohnilembus persalinus]|eukprot:KRX06144.1 hypothetical protein PPERSA_00024 [Pseudocohnilembus persalinus]